MKKLMRGAALGAVTALAATTATVVGVAPAQAAPAGDSAAGWLAGQLTKGLINNPNFGGFDDYGLSIDTALAINATGTNAAAVNRIRDALAPKVGAYVEYTADFTRPDLHATAGALGKIATFAQVAGANASSFGGRNLVSELEARVGVDGRIADQLVPGDIDSATAGTQLDQDYANTLGQAFAARSLTVAGSAKAPSATDFLLKQQCASGFFRLQFTADQTAADQNCLDGDAGSKPNVDATAQTVVQLAALKRKTPEVSAAITRASDWLAEQQNKDGSFGGSAPTSGPNSNSTGLAGWALGGQGYCVPAARADGWIEDLQVSEGDGPLGDDEGAIAYDQDAFDAGETDGITTKTSDQWRRATAQAAPAVARAVYGEQCEQRLLVIAKKRRVNEGNKQKLVIRKLEAGEKVKIQIKKRTIKGTANRFGTFKKRFSVNKKIAQNLPNSRKVKIKVTGEFADIRRGKGKFYIKR